MNMHRDEQTERLIVACLIGHALDQGYRISVHDDFSILLVQSRNPEEIWSHLFSTDQDTLLFYRGTERAGWVQLMYGNGPDVIADHSDRPHITNLVRPIQNLAEELYEWHPAVLILEANPTPAELSWVLPNILQVDR